MDICLFSNGHIFAVTDVFGDNRSLDFAGCLLYFYPMASRFLHQSASICSVFLHVISPYYQTKAFSSAFEHCSNSIKYQWTFTL